MGGFLTGFAGEVTGQVDRAREQETLDRLKLRERRADELENAINNIQARGALQPDQPGYLGPGELKFHLSEAQKQLAALYQPHEAPDLFKRLKKIFHKGEAQTPAPDPTTTVPGIQVGAVTLPGRTQEFKLTPGMTLSDILAAGAPIAPAAKAGAIPKATTDPFIGDDGKWYQIFEDASGNLTRKELPGYTQETERSRLKREGLSDEEIEKYLPVALKLASSKSTAKGYKYDPQTDEVVNQDTTERYSRDDLNKEETPEVVARMFSGATTQQKKKDEAADKRFRQGMQRLAAAFNYALQRGDHQQAEKILLGADTDLIKARERLHTMQLNLKDALATGNQQAMLSITANHIGMTLGSQRGARITRAVWEEAMASTPWLEGKIAKFFHQDENGDYIFDGWKGGVTLTKDQMEQMVGLAEQKVETLGETLDDMQSDPLLSEALGKHGKGRTKKETKTTPTDTGDKEMQDILKGLSTIKP